MSGCWTSWRRLSGYATTLPPLAAMRAMSPIMGQSGGGMKVNVLMAMPVAHGLFHKAVNLSGPRDRMLTPEGATANTERLLARLGVARGNLHRLQTLPAATLLRACSEVESYDWYKGTHLEHAFSPVVDGRALPSAPFDPEAPAICEQIPMMVGNCADEVGPGVRRFVKQHEPFDDSKMTVELKKMGFAPAAIESLLQGYRKDRPNASVGDILAAIKTDAEFRMGGIAIAEGKAKQPALVFSYLFSRKATAIGSTDGAAHSMDMAFFFDNLDRAPGLVGAPPEPHAQEFARHMSNALASFARTGDPNHSGLPRWEPYSSSRRSTMIFDRACRVVEDPGGTERIALRTAEEASQFSL